jgi:hypothetical protein
MFRWEDHIKKMCEYGANSISKNEGPLKNIFEHVPNMMKKYMDICVTVSTSKLILVHGISCSYTRAESGRRT